MEGAAEWLEADGLGGFASGTVSGIRTRRYHALLLHAQRPPTERMLLVNGFDAWVEIGGRRVALSSQAYLPDAVHPDGAARIDSFQAEPWPRWTFRLPGGERVVQELFVPRGAAAVALGFRLEAPASAAAGAALELRPFVSGRDYHALQRENGALRFEVAERDGLAHLATYPGVPAFAWRANARYEHAPLWYRSFRYEEERARGFDFVEDLASPGALRFDLCAGPGVWLLAAEGHEAIIQGGSPLERFLALREAERGRRAAFPSPAHRAADAYLVRRGRGRTLVAGYPWFTDWGRDTFVALRGLCLATARRDVTREILLEWAGAVSEGMLPNRFPDRGEAPEFNSVDAALWYVVAAHEWLATCEAAGEPAAAPDRERVEAAVDAILEGHARGTRHGIRMDADGLLAAGEPGVQLTWMDARVGERVVTPRIGKPVEVQALWANALWLRGRRAPRWRALAERVAEAFRGRFWNEREGALYDVVDADHRAGAVDASFRPNQIFAVGGLPLALLEGERARRVVDAVERRLWTPLGLRSLAPDAPGYRGRYAGGPEQRDLAYHQGTAWPWLLGPFVEAWVRVRGGSAEARREASRRFVAPLREHLGQAGLGHVSEVADGDPSHRPGGCPFQAWSLAELLRLELCVLAEGQAPARGTLSLSAREGGAASAQPEGRT